MNRIAFESLFYNDKSMPTELQRLNEGNTMFFSTEPLAPEFVLSKELDFCEGPLSHEESTNSSDSLSNGSTNHSNFSHSESQQKIYIDIFRNRSNHAPFADLEKNTGQTCEWRFLDTHIGVIKGPYSAEEVDRRFRWGLLGEKTIIFSQNDKKGKILSSYIKDHVKRMIFCRVSQKGGIRKMSNKMMRFMNSDAFPRRDSLSEAYEQSARTDRVRSTIVRPNLEELVACIADGADEEREYFGRRVSIRSGMIRPFICV
jgi:hypothetical protein